MAPSAAQGCWEGHVRGASSAPSVGRCCKQHRGARRGRGLVSQALGLGTTVPLTDGMTVSKDPPRSRPQFPHLCSQAPLTLTA